MRNEYVDSTEVLRRIQLGIYDHEEFERALTWTRANCKEGEDFNQEHKIKSREEKEKDWEFVVKMALIIRDLMIGNPKLGRWGIPKKRRATMP